MYIVLVDKSFSAVDHNDCVDHIGFENEAAETSLDRNLDSENAQIDKKNTFF